MKRKIIILAAITSLSITLPCRASAQFFDPTEILKAIIMAIDLGVQKAQTQTIYLQNAQKAIENAMQQLHLTDITTWVQKQKDLYSGYYQELWQIKDALTSYQKVKDIIDKQAQIIREYKAAYAMVGADPHFSPSELQHIYSVYNTLLDESAKNVSQLGLVISAFVTQMSDGERMRIIDDAARWIDQNATRLRVFTQGNILLSLQRSKGEAEVNSIKSLYGIQ
jgi:uncharacterized protein YhaN